MDERLVDNVQGDSSSVWTCTLVEDLCHPLGLRIFLKSVPAAAAAAAAAVVHCSESSPKRTDTEEDDQVMDDWSFIADMPELPRPAFTRSKMTGPMPKWVRNIRSILKERKQQRSRPAGPRDEAPDRQGHKRSAGTSDRDLPPPAKRPSH